MSRNCVGMIFLLLLTNTLLHSESSVEPYEKARKRMVEVIEREVRETRGYLEREALSQTTLDAMERVPRHAFVPADSRSYAYQNRPLSIGYGQTISQPYIVAVMTDMLDLKPTDRVLEIGTGSGYQAAVLAEIVKEVYSVEVIKELGFAAKTRLARLGYHNVETKIGDGYYGWEEHAPYDAIIVTAAAGQIPPPLLKQLKPGGKMIIPVKSFYYVQHLVLVSKDKKGAVTTRQTLPVMFVPLTGEH